MIDLLSYLGRGGKYGYFWLRQPESLGGKKKSVWYDLGQPIPQPTSQPVNVYYGIHPAAAVPSQHTNKLGKVMPAWAVRPYISELSAINCLFGEFDAKDFNGDKTQTRQHIESLALPPSVLIDSGGGFHAYWLLKDPCILSEDNRDDIKRLQASWVQFIGSDPAAKDLARVLRVPGTYNYKYDPPRLVDYVYKDFDNFYWLDDFMGVVSQQPARQAAQAASQPSPAPTNGKYNNTQDDWITYLLGQALERGKPGSRNAAGFWLACQLRDAGIDQPRAESVLVEYGNKCGGETQQKIKEGLESVSSAYSQAARAVPSRAGVPSNGNGHKPARHQQPAASAAASAPPAQPQPAGLLPEVPSINLDAIKTGLDDQETGDAQLTARLWAGKLLYDHTEGCWYTWAGHYWKQDNTGLTHWLIARGLAPQYLWAAAETLKAGNEPLSKEFIKRARALQNRKRIDNVLYLASKHEDLSISGQEWDSNPWLLGCENGVIELTSGVIRAGKPVDYIKSHSPAAWQDINTPAPAWEKFLRDIFDQNQNMVNFIARLLGYGITGLTIEHILPVLWGDGRNGKSTLLETLGDVLGAELSTSSQADALMDLQKLGGGPQPFIYGLRGKRFVWASESNEGRRINAGLVKQLTGGDRLNVRTLHSKPIEFKPTHLLFLLTNHKPHISADDQAIWERVLLIPFGLRFVDQPRADNERKKDPYIRAALGAELPGILAWLVRGCLEWQQQGLQPPAAVVGATSDYRTEEDTTGQFINEKCILKDGAETRASALYAQYKSWCQAAGVSPMSQTALGKILKKRFLTRESHGIIYLGLGLLDDNIPF